MMFDDPSSPDASAPAPAVVETPSDAPAQSAAVQRYRSCRWRRPPEDGDLLDYCAHRDVLPMTGTTGFDPEAWCPECSFYKVRRVPKKRSPEDYRY